MKRGKKVRGGNDDEAIKGLAQQILGMLQAKDVEKGKVDANAMNEILDKLTALNGLLSTKYGLGTPVSKHEPVAVPVGADFVGADHTTAPAHVSHEPLVHLPVPAAPAEELDNADENPLDTTLHSGGKSKKRTSKKRGGSYNLPAMSNTDGLVTADRDPIVNASVHVGSLVNTPSPFSAGLNTDFNDSTKTIPRAIVDNIVPPVGKYSGGKARQRSKKL